MPLGDGVQVRRRDPLSLAVDRHLVPLSPLPFGVERVRHVVRGCELPCAVLGKQKTNVLGVVVAVDSSHVEHHAPVALSYCVRAHAEEPDGVEVLVVGVLTGLAEVGVGQPVERRRVHSIAILAPVEPSSEEVGAPVLLQQPALAHRDAGGSGHEVVGVLDTAVRGTCPERVDAPVEACRPGAIEFDEPVAEAGRGR